MNKELILNSDVLDIIFEKRNKAYGAYTLRKFYNNRLMKSLGLMFGAVIILSAFTFLPEKKKVTPGFYEASPTFIPKAPDNRKEIEKPKTAQAAKPPQATQPLGKPVISDQSTQVKPITTIVDSVALTTIKTNSGTTGDGPVTFPTGAPGVSPVSPSPEPAKPVFDKTQAIANPDVMPTYPGGMDALRRFLQRNLANPKDIEDGSTVSVKIQFVVGYDGKLQRFQIVEDGGEAFNNEVIRVLKKMPEWIPGKTNGEDVSVYYTIPVKFVPSE